ncbi:MAG: alpha/beta fold hydrolase [Candidatus Zixiibacteriota bacterium]|nr:MAG: alpha/beta fold hydrolase [candidate division Zixibacteria bacterium]
MSIYAWEQRRNFLINLCAFLLIFQLATTSQGESVPRFELASIPDSIAPASGEVEFGHLVVYENRADSNSPTIKLPVMIGKSRAENSRPDPILFTVGGPGVISTMRGGRDLNAWPYLDDRDFIYFEQRGAQYAQPSLIGPEIDSILLNNSGERMNGQLDRDELIAAVRRLRERLEAQGIDLTCYSTRESAADIEDLRKVLGIEKWNLYGISYSCRLMLEVMRRYPDGVRAVILDSPLPPDVSWDETSIDRYWSNVMKLATHCGADSVVNEKYPNLKDRLLDLIKEANENPIAVSVTHPATGQAVQVSIDGEGIFRILAAYMGNTSYIYSFPYSMDLLCRKNTEVLAFLAPSLLGIPEYSWGMRYSIWCNEEFPFDDFGKFARHEDLPAPLSGLEWTIVEPEIYDFWPRRPLDTLDNQPVFSQIPALVVNGQYDPDTPPEWGKHVCETLTNSYYFEYPGQGHLPLFIHPCGRQMGIDFLNDPSTRPSDSCLVASGPFRFYSGE